MAIKYASSLASGGGDGSFGDPFTLAELIADTHAAGDDLRLIADGTYSRSATWTFATAGNQAATITIRGCEASAGTVDGTKATLQASAGSLTLLTVTAQHVTVEHLTLDGNSQTSVTGLQISTYDRCADIHVTGTTAYGARASGNSSFLYRVTATGCSGTTAIEVAANATARYCVAWANSCSGFRHEANSNSDFCQSFSNTGSSSHGFACASVGYRAIGCIAYDNGGDGFDLSGNAGFGTFLDGCIAYGNATEGFGSNGVKAGAFIRNCAGGSNTSGNYNASNLSPTDFVSLTADPFADADNGDFNINDTAGGGAALRAVILAMP